MPRSPAPERTPPVPAGGLSGGRRVRIGRLWIDALTFPEVLREIQALVAAGRGGCVFTPNVDHVVVAEDDGEFLAAYREASLSLADGQPLVWASRALGTPLPAKISGSDLAWPLLELSARMRWRVYLLGGSPGVAEAAAARLARELGVHIVGVDAPVVDLESPGGEARAAVERLGTARPDLLIVALGTPKQERWIHRHLELIRPAVAVGMGATLDFVAGRVRRAPAWMSRSGLEWLFRLCREPRRLARRYLLRDLRFLPIVVRTALSPRPGRVQPRASAIAAASREVAP